MEIKMTNDLNSITTTVGKEMVEEFYGKKFKWEETEEGFKARLHATLIEIKGGRR